ncbi:hypothetical protein B0H10DRAFT_1949204 [Mycena sp. CBHHK59/15]|nr:hypothetical protein B0H10DRAFT_1949204 [Mycena sp. CBHHK59/15]
MGQKPAGWNKKPPKSILGSMKYLQAQVPDPHGGHFLGQSVHIRIGHATTYAEVLLWSPTQSGARGSFIRGDVRTWHRPSFPLPKYWSCDWLNWDNAEEYHHSHMSTEIMNKLWGVAGEVEPLAFVPEEVGPESVFVFFTNGVYYWYTYGQLRWFDGPFADHDDFLQCLDDKEIWGGGIVVNPTCFCFTAVRQDPRQAKDQGIHHMRELQLLATDRERKCPAFTQSRDAALKCVVDRISGCWAALDPDTTKFMSKKRRCSPARMDGVTQTEYDGGKVNGGWGMVLYSEETGEGTKGRRVEDLREGEKDERGDGKAIRRNSGTGRGRGRCASGRARKEGMVEEKQYAKARNADVPRNLSKIYALGRCIEMVIKYRPSRARSDTSSRAEFEINLKEQLKHHRDMVVWLFPAQVGYYLYFWKA